jgi:uncharacterized membrane protein YgcG
MGMSMNKSDASSSSQQTARSWTDVWSNQIPYLESLYSTGSRVIGDMLNKQDPNSFATPAREAWARMLNPGKTPGLDASIAEAQRRAGEGFRENVMPAITESAVNANALGGDRGGIAAGIAGREAMREQSNIAQRMTLADYEGQQQRILQALSMSGGLQSLSQSSLAPLLALAQIIGRPTTLSGSESQGTSQSESSGFGFGIGMGGGAFGGGGG